MSRELDARVAAEVFGYVVRDSREVEGLRRAVGYEAGKDIRTFVMGYQPGDEPTGDSWRMVSCFSEDLLAAWRVVEKLRGDGWSVNLNVYPPANDATCYCRATILNPVSWHPDLTCNASGASMPEAICRCAVRAVQDRAIWMKREEIECPSLPLEEEGNG